MAIIEIKNLPAGTPTQAKKLAMDLVSTESASIKDIVFAGRPSASQAEAEAGVDAEKVMTPMNVKQSIAAEVGVSIASDAQGNLADTALQPTTIGNFITPVLDNLGTLSATNLTAFNAVVINRWDSSSNVSPATYVKASSVPSHQMYGTDSAGNIFVHGDPEVWLDAAGARRWNPSAPVDASAALQRAMNTGKKVMVGGQFLLQAGVNFSISGQIVEGLGTWLSGFVIDGNFDAFTFPGVQYCGLRSLQFRSRKEAQSSFPTYNTSGYIAALKPNAGGTQQAVGNMIEHLVCGSCAQGILMAGTSHTFIHDFTFGFYRGQYGVRMAGTGATDVFKNFSCIIHKANIYTPYALNNVAVNVSMGDFSYSLNMAQCLLGEANIHFQMVDSTAGSASDSSPRWAFWTEVECDRANFHNIHLVRGFGFEATSCWSNTAQNGSGVAIEPTYTGMVKIMGTEIGSNRQAGVVIGAGPKDILLQGNSISSNSTSGSAQHGGVKILGGASDISIIGNTCGLLPSVGSNLQSYGIVIDDSATTNRLIIADNNVNGNVTGGIYDGSTTTLKRIHGNVGFEFSSTISGASPISFTNNKGSDLTVYVTGGTVSNISVDGKTVGVATNTQVKVPRGKVLAVTYSSAPTITYTGE